MESAISDIWIHALGMLAGAILIDLYRTLFKRRTKDSQLVVNKIEHTELSGNESIATDESKRRKQRSFFVVIILWLIFFIIRLMTKASVSFIAAAVVGSWLFQNVENSQSVNNNSMDGIILFISFIAFILVWLVIPIRIFKK